MDDFGRILEPFWEPKRIKKDSKNGGRNRRRFWEAVDALGCQNGAKNENACVSDTCVHACLQASRRSSENMKNLCFPIEKHRFLRFEGGCFGNKIDAKTESEIEFVLGMMFE